MDWTLCILCFLCVSVGQSQDQSDAEPAMYGEVHSPDYPQPYAPNLQVQWELSVPEGFHIRLTFTHMDIEASAGCYYDALKVLYNGKVLGRYCGRENSADGHHPGNHPILSPGNRLTLMFQTDSNNPERHQNLGFFAHYQAIDMDECSAPAPADGSGPLCSQICLNTLGSYQCSCRHGFELRPDERTCVLSCGGGIFDEPQGHLLSPGFPQSPPHGVTCEYVISVESGFTVTLNFSDTFHIESLDTEHGRSCPHHWLQVTVPGSEPRKLCGPKSPGLISTNSNTVRLEYHTDDEGLSKGWSLDYSTDRVSCSLPGRVTNGRVTPTMHEYFYRDYIFIKCDPGYKLMMAGREIRSFSAMCQSNGQWHLPLPECHIIDCGEPEPLLNGGVTFLSGIQNQYLSVVQYHCNEPYYTLFGGRNVKFTCEADRKWRSNTDVVVSPTCLPVCGQPTAHVKDFQRIIGGKNAPKNTIPWQVMLSIDGGRGGGMVIADRWILTAAHVLSKERVEAPVNTIRIFMGSNNARTDLGPAVNAFSIHLHPQYNTSDDMNYDNDIALIKLQDPITFHAAVMPICLPADGAAYDDGVMGLVSGFGLDIIGDKSVLTNKLKYVPVPLVNQETCIDSITSKKNEMGENRVPNLTNNMFCAGFPEGGKDSCKGDSGGPFALTKNGSFWAAGVVSWGVDCGKPGTYGVYTKVVNYLDWINKTMREN
ncbi:complement C1r subcomponent-like [Betta splendens]|uniref:complement subcomponent C1r n=1 Tax=Betta splendens TaxID=158456 RepID=A0A6P7KTB6_BETSP|nr:complement C1r subcomponent-like [Betta splendens]